jgi:hypothetical protein
VDTSGRQRTDGGLVRSEPGLLPLSPGFGPGTLRTGQNERYATLIHYGSQVVTADLVRWFDFYNARQTIEAGVKEGKRVFEMHHLKFRSTAGLTIQEEFTVLAANLVRWGATWLHEQPFQAKAPFDRPHASVKQLVRIGSNTTVVVMWQPEGNLLLTFDELGPFPGVELLIGHGRALQPPWPLYRNDGPEST